MTAYVDEKPRSLGSRGSEQDAGATAIAKRAKGQKLEAAGVAITAGKAAVMGVLGAHLDAAVRTHRRQLAALRDGVRRRLGHGLGDHRLVHAIHHPRAGGGGRVFLEDRAPSVGRVPRRLVRG